MQDWIDERLSWDDSISELDEIVVHGGNIWRPEFAVINGYDVIRAMFMTFDIKSRDVILMRSILCRRSATRERLYFYTFSGATINNITLHFTQPASCADPDLQNIIE